MVLIATGAWLASSQAQAPKQTPKTSPSLVPPQPTPKAAEPIATVGARTISRQEFESREKVAMSDYRQRVGQDVPPELRPALRRQLLESLIRREMLVQEAPRRGITVSDDEADAQLQREPFFNPGGRFDPQRFQVVKTTQVENYQRAIAQLKPEIAASKLNDELQKEFVGNDPTIKAGAERALSRADLQMLALRRTEYRGDIREPRETEILAWYHAHPEQFQSPARATFTALQVDQPPLAEGVALDSPAGRAWKSKMRTRADSALAAARAGATFEALEKACGSIRHDAEVVGDNFPGFWGGDANDRKAFFAARAGQLVAIPVSSQTGWLVIRVEQQQPAGVAPIGRVARQIRDQLRADARSHGEERELRQAYAAKGDSLKGTAWKLRYAAFDTGTVAVPNPAPADLDRWYRSHQADYSNFDPVAGVIKVRPFAEVEGEVRDRWIREQRSAIAQSSSDRLLALWQKNQRDKTLERSASVMREVGPVFESGAPDSGDAGRTLGDSLARRPWDLRAGSIAWARGSIVYQIYERTPNTLPTFEQARPALEVEAAEAKRAKDEAGARALYDTNPAAFSSGRTICYSQIVVQPEDPPKIKLTREQVERYRERHIDRYSAPEQVRVKHILIRVDGAGAAADSAARRRAQQLRDRIVAGENFDDLAKKYSDDVATRDKGGDLGLFGHGAMIESFERVAFSLRAGELSEVVRTDAGYDVMQCTQHDPIVAQPLRYVYTNVGWDAASEMADSMAHRRVDSLAAACKTAAQLKAAAKKLGLFSESSSHVIGDTRGGPEVVSFNGRLEKTAPGSVVPGTAFVRSSGWFVAWVDSITSGRQLDWEEARSVAIEVYQRDAGRRVLSAKQAELDSLMRAGWTLDSLGTLAGGLDRVPEASAGNSYANLGRSVVMDSLVFGTSSTGPVLKPGQTGPWVELASAVTRPRVSVRKAPEPDRLAAQIENDRKVAYERKLYDYFEGLKGRYPVKIMDPVLRDTPVAPPKTQASD
jgi:parvulin-like peptidyl-prolyl isomerase